MKPEDHRAKLAKEWKVTKMIGGAALIAICIALAACQSAVL